MLFWTVLSVIPSFHLFCSVDVGSWLLSELHICLNSVLTFEVPSRVSLQPLPTSPTTLIPFDLDLADSQIIQLQDLNIAELKGSNKYRTELEFILVIQNVTLYLLSLNILSYNNPELYSVILWRFCIYDQ